MSCVYAVVLGLSAFGLSILTDQSYTLAVTVFVVCLKEPILGSIKCVPFWFSFVGTQYMCYLHDRFNQTSMVGVELLIALESFAFELVIVIF